MRSKRTFSTSSKISIENERPLNQSMNPETEFIFESELKTKETLEMDSSVVTFDYESKANFDYESNINFDESKIQDPIEQSLVLESSEFK